MKRYLVGGAVRDRLLGRTVYERDWVVVGATVEQMLAQGYKQVGKDFPVFLHPHTGEEHALARTERKAGTGHRGFVVHADPGVTLVADLERRDLTINAMAEDERGDLIDPYHGFADLTARRLRQVSAAFVEDPLRVFRVARFKAQLAPWKFFVADELQALLTHMAASGELDTLPAERVFAEMSKALACPDGADFFMVLAAAGALAPWFTVLQRRLTEAMATLTRASSSALAVHQRFAALCSVLSEVDAAALCQRIKVPKHWQQVVHMSIAERMPLQGWRHLSDEDLLALLERADAMRRTERFHDVCAVVEVLTGELLTELRERVNALRVIKLNVGTANGADAKRIVRDARLARLRELRR